MPNAKPVVLILPSPGIARCQRCGGTTYMRSMTDVVKCPGCGEAELKSDMLATVKKLEEACAESGCSSAIPASAVASKESWLATVQILENADVVVLCPDSEDSTLIWWAGVAFARSKPVLIYGESTALDVITAIGYSMTSHILEPEQLKKFLAEHKEADNTESSG